MQQYLRLYFLSTVLYMICRKIANTPKKILVNLLISVLQINVLDYDLLLIPVHLHCHWALGVCVSFIRLLYYRKSIIDSYIY